MNTPDANLEAPTLATLHEAILDTATLEQFFRDLAVCTEVIEIIPKFAARAMAPQQNLSLDQAHELITSSRARAIQIRYRYDGAEWWDTLMQTPQGIRIVRIRHEFER